MAKISREIETVSKMVKIYCTKKHSTKSNLCEQCASLLRYTVAKIKECPHFQETGNKPSCRRCKIHCFALEKRAEIKKIMIFSGPRMLWSAPIDYARHLFR